MPRHRKPSPPLPRIGAMALLALLALPILEFGLWEAWHDAPTYDEGIYLSSGVDLLTSHQWRLTIEHPPLSRAIGVLPVLLAHPVIPSSPAQHTGDEYAWSRVFLAAQQRAGKLRLEMFLARLFPLLEAIATGLVIYAVGRALTDRWGGVVAAGFWFTLPTTLALGHLMTIDVTLSLTVALTAWALLRLHEKPVWSRVAALGVITGISVLVRSTALPMVVPAALLAWVFTRRLWRGVLAALGVGLVSFVTVWVGVRLIAPVSAHLPPPSAFATPFPQASPVPHLENAAASLPWPHEFATGLRVLGRLSVPAPGYLFGHRWVGIWWAYWPLTLLAKVPMSAWLIVLVGVVGWRGVAAPSRRLAALVLLPLAFAAGLPALVTTRQLGIRLLLPVIALLAIAAAPAARLVRAPVGRMVLGLLCAAQLATLATASGSALAWTMPPLHPAYRLMSDSNFDWGQDWYRLNDWAATHDAWVGYFGSPGLAELIPAKNLLAASPQNVAGWVAVSASYLTDYRFRELSWLRAYCPVGSIGSTVLIYRFHGPASGLPGPSTPVPPCFGATFSHR